MQGELSVDDMMDAVQIKVSREMNIDIDGTRNELARADAMGHMRVAVGHACKSGRERAESDGGASCPSQVTANNSSPFSTSFPSLLSSTTLPPRHARRHSQEKEDCRPRLPLSW